VASGAVVAVGVAPPLSAGSPAAGVVVPAGSCPPPAQAPSIVARLNMRAKPKIFVFITPLSPNKGNRNISPVVYDSLFVDFC
jgi:hypothetical protein